MRSMVSRVVAITTLSVTLLAPAASASQSQTVLFVQASSQVATTIVAFMPLLRLHFNHPLSAKLLPALRVSPALLTRWQQIGTHDVQAVTVGATTPSVAYSITLPTIFKCSLKCTVASAHVVHTSVNVNITWEEQLLAQLNYLPVSFTPLTNSSQPSREMPGYFSWRFPLLPKSFIAQWSPGVSNVILTGALMNFQNVHGIPTAGVMNPATWNTLVKAANAHQVNPSSYNYIDVIESSPEILVMYVNGVGKFRTFVNTGISVAPTSFGTYPVYLRYTTQTMSGTNPDGSHYSDPGIPWVSYFNGGDALHGFIRASYGYPQSLGCVEMPFASAATIWPHTPIGTLVTVHA